MSKIAGLADRARYEAFTRQWRDTALREAEKWCTDKEARELLADAVLTDFRKKYAHTDPPDNLDYYIKAQVCLVYSVTGQNSYKLASYIAENSIPEESEETQAKPVHAVFHEEISEPETRPVPAPPSTDESAGKPAVSAAEQPAPVPAAEQPVPVPAAEQPVSESPIKPAAPAHTPEKPAGRKPDTFLDPVRTTYWTPDSERSEHVVQEIEIPDEEEEDRSVIISFINTILFLLTAGSFVFCVYESGFFQYLLQ
jgi:hypothetical protein